MTPTLDVARQAGEAGWRHLRQDGPALRDGDLRDGARHRRAGRATSRSSRRGASTSPTTCWTRARASRQVGNLVRRHGLRRVASGRAPGRHHQPRVRPQALKAIGSVGEQPGLRQGAHLPAAHAEQQRDQRPDVGGQRRRLRVLPGIHATTSKAEPKSYGSATYAGVLSYTWANVKKTDPRVQAVLKWVRDNYTVDENPGLGQKTVYYYYMVLAKALQAVGDPVIVDSKGRSHNWREDLGRKLLTLQHPEGYWVNEVKDEMQDNKVLVTTASPCRRCRRSCSKRGPRAMAARHARHPTRAGRRVRGGVAASSPARRRRPLAGALTLTGHRRGGRRHRSPGRWTPMSITVDATGEPAAGVLTSAGAMRRGAAGIRPCRRAQAFRLLPADDGCRRRGDPSRFAATAYTGGRRPARARPARRQRPSRSASPLRLPDRAAAAGLHGRNHRRSAPRSVRGYDAVDRVTWPGGSDAAAARRPAAGAGRAGARCGPSTKGQPRRDRPAAVHHACTGAKEPRVAPAARHHRAFLLLLVTAAAAPATPPAPHGLRLRPGLHRVRRRRRPGGGPRRLPERLCASTTPRSSSSSRDRTDRSSPCGARRSFPRSIRMPCRPALADAAIRDRRGTGVRGKRLPRSCTARSGPGAREVFTLEGASDIRPLAYRARRRGAASRNPSATICTTAASPTALRSPRSTCCVPASRSRPYCAASRRPRRDLHAAQLPVDFVEGGHPCRAQGRTLVAAYLDPAGDGAR